MIVVTLLRKPLGRNETVASNSLATGTGGINVDGCRVGMSELDIVARRSRNGFTIGVSYGHHGTLPFSDGSVSDISPNGRWPANLILTEITVDILDAQSGTLTSGSGTAFNRNADKFRSSYGKFEGARAERGYYGDTGGASRFFKKVDIEKCT